MKLIIITTLALYGASTFAKQSCVPAPSEQVCLLLGGTFDAKKKICCIEVKKDNSSSFLFSLLEQADSRICQ